MINEKKDIIGRDDNYQKIEIDNTYPEYLLKNLEMYKNWVI